MNDCKACQKIIEFEQALDQRAKKLVDRVNELCRPTRDRNNQRWEEFASYAKLPLVGTAIYSFLRAPKGLEQEPNYLDSDWYNSEGSAIELAAFELEKLKADHTEHWGEEFVIPGLRSDPSGYYTPPHMIKRRECYDENFCTQMKIRLAGHDCGRKEHYFVHLPDKYDFRSVAGVPKLQKGTLVMDSRTKKVVPKNECDFVCKDLKHYAKGPISWLSARTARSGTTYRHRKV